MRYSRGLVGLMLVLTTAATAPSGEGAYCNYPTLTYVLKLACRDGAACDLDGSCNGSCLLATFQRTSDRVNQYGETGCFTEAKLAKHPPRSQRWLSFDLGPFFNPLRTGVRGYWDGKAPASIRVRCRPARRSCVPAPPAEGSVAVAGFLAPELSQFAARAYAATPPFWNYAEPFFRVYMLGDTRESDQRLFINVSGSLAVGMYPASALNAEVWIAGYSASGQPSDGELRISSIEPSGTYASVVHGTFHGTIKSQIPLNQDAPVIVDATF